MNSYPAGGPGPYPGGQYPGQYPAAYPPAAWRRPAGPAKALRVLLLLTAIALALQALASVVRRNVYQDVLGGDGRFSRIDDADAFLGLTLLAAAGLMVAVFVLTIVWEWRLAKNHELLGRPGTTFGPGWAIGAWFIPLANFVLPYLQFRDLWKGSAPGLAPGDPTWKRSKVAPMLTVWWFTFVASYVLEWINSIEFALNEEATFFDEPSIGGTVAALGLRVVAAVALFVVVGQLTERQAAAVAATPMPYLPGVPGTWTAASSPAPAYGTPPPPAPGVPYPPAWGQVPLAPPPDRGAGWKPDPTRRASYRYWDGSRWTEHAATGGQAFTSPL